MKLETFFEKFDLFADAPDAVAKMRELVLHLAVTGKLVEQDPNDEPANSLLAQVACEKRQLVAKKKIRQFDEAAPIAEEDLPFDVPAGWEWARLSTITRRIHYGYTASTKAEIKEVRLLRITDIQNNAVDWNSVPGCEIAEDEVPQYRIERGDILVARTGGTVGKTYLVRDVPVIAVFASYLIRIQGASGLFDRYLKVFLESPTYWVQLQKGARGAAQPNVNGQTLGRMIVSIPPLAEQKRIVAKVDELMALCDRLAQQQEEREEQASNLARATLARFADAPTPVNLQLLFHSSFNIPPSDLRKSILTLAVQGKLVPQDPNDEPAEELVANVGRDRERIAKEQSVRLPKNVPALTVDNYPHDIPESWKWSRIGNLALVIDYGTSQKADGDSRKVPVYRMGNIIGGRLIDKNLKYVDSGIDDLPGLYLKTHDILFNRTNSYELVGKVGIYTGPENKATFASYLIRIRLPDGLLYPPFFSLAMNASYFRQTQIEPEVIQQCGQANFNGTKLASTVVPIPPLAEQRRIVAKVDELMALVDALETQLASARTTATALLSAALAELTNPKESPTTPDVFLGSHRRGNRRTHPHSKGSDDHK